MSKAGLMVNKCPISLIKRKKYFNNPQSLDEAMCHIANILEMYHGEKRECTRNTRLKQKKVYHCLIIFSWSFCKQVGTKNKILGIKYQISICGFTVCRKGETLFFLCEGSPNVKLPSLRLGMRNPRPVELNAILQH